MSSTGSDSQAVLFAVNDLIARLAAKRDKTSKRADARYSLNSPVVLGKMRGNQFSPTCEAYGMDISNQGLGMISRVEVFPGQQFVVNLQSAIGSPCFVKLNIVYCTSILPGMFRCGGAFEFDI